LCAWRKDNPGWGYTRIQGALGNLGHRVGRGTVANVLKRSGIEPSPKRSKRTTWSTFLKAHWEVRAASDFMTAEVWTTRGLVTHYLLFVISLADRVVDIVGIATRPDAAWMLQAGRNLTDSESGAMRAKGYLILDRDTKYTNQFRRLIRGSGTNVIRLPPRSPNLNAYAERFVRSIKYECLNQMIFIGQASLRRAVAEYMAHLPRGAKSSGAGQLADPGGPELCRRSWDDPPEAETWRDAQLLLPRSGVTGVDRIIGQYGIALSHKRQTNRHTP